MLIISDFSQETSYSASARDQREVTEAAKLQGFRLYYIPSDFSRCGDGRGALAHLPPQETPTPAIWIGYIPSPERYGSMYHAALEKNIQLVNDPQQHLIVQEFDRAYPRLAELTPESRIITPPSEVEEAAKALGLPLFVRGSVRSRKAAGLKACVANDQDELKGLVEGFLKSQYQSRGRVIARKFLLHRRRFLERREDEQQASDVAFEHGPVRLAAETARVAWLPV